MPIDAVRGSRLTRGSFGQLTFSVCLTAAVFPPLMAAEVPVPCVAGSCGAQAPTFVTSGTASTSSNGNLLTVDQASRSATLNWQSFNISRDAQVRFNQPDSASVALNRIYQADPSRIAGSLTANGQVYLLNPNGVIFGNGASVNVGGLLAASLDLTPQALQNGLARAAESGAPALQPFTSATGETLLGGAVRVEPGATLQAPGGQIMLFAPEVSNMGSISTPDGQAILGAGNRVFLAASMDPNIRGLLVEVGGGGIVSNGGQGVATDVARIAADRGNVTLAGSLVRQAGTVSATTSVRANGTIRLQARDTAQTTISAGSNVQLRAERGGILEVGKNSQTTVTLDTTSDETTVDVNAQPLSSVEMRGRQINIDEGARVVATGGRISAFAATNPDPQQRLQDITATADTSQLRIADGAVLDVSGASVELAVERNIIAVELRGSQLADSPVQRDGTLRSQKVYVDARQYGTRADGSTWIGTPLADVSGDVSNIRRGVAERNLNGGSIELASGGAALVGQGATLDVSGGQVNWRAGMVSTTQLLGKDGKAYDIAAADRDREYAGIADSRVTNDLRWGVQETLSLPGRQGVYEAAHVEGRDAGSVTIVAPQVALDGRIDGSTVTGAEQRRSAAAAFNSAGQLTGSRHDVVAQGASLTLGLAQPRVPSLPNYVIPDLEFAPGLVLGAHFGLDTLVSFAGLQTTRIRPELFGQDGVSRFAAYLNGRALLDSQYDLALPAGGSFALTAGRIQIGGDISVAAGNISLTTGLTDRYRGLTASTTPELRVTNGASLFAGGMWVNDLEAQRTGQPFAPLLVHGGRISLASNGGSLDVSEGGTFDASGGAQLAVNGVVVGGRAGAISLGTFSSDVNARTALALGAQLQAYGLEDGGSLSLTANSVCIAGQDCATNLFELALRPELFMRGGFANYAIGTTLGGLQLAPGTSLAVRQQNLQLLAGAQRAGSGTSIAALTEVVMLPDFQRNAANLTLTAKNTSIDYVPADLVLGAGSSLFADPLARISLNTNARMVVDGGIHARGGDIRLLLDNTSRVRGFRPDQSIWLGSQARLDASGVVRYTPTEVSPMQGEVLAGGSVTVQAERGFVFTDTSSEIDVSGAAADVDIRDAAGALHRQHVGADAGQVLLGAAEGMAVNGAIAAHGGAAAGTAGGQLTIRLDASRRRGDPVNGFPVGDRTVLVTSQPQQFQVAPLTAAPATAQGIARVSDDLITQSGADFVTLGARDLYYSAETGDLIFGGYGGIQLESGVNLAPAARLVLEAPRVQVTGEGSAQLSSSYLAFGSTDLQNQDAPDAVAGGASLRAQADFIDLIGNVTFQGIDSLHLDSASDIRARGGASIDRSDYLGALRSAGLLAMTAQQIYPATLSRYTFAASGADGSIVTRQAAGTASPVLAAGGSLALEAAHISHGGTLLAPLGSLSLAAERVETLAGSVLSTKLQELVPFGQTQGGLDWVYNLDQNQGTRVYGGTRAALPDRQISIDADVVSLGEGSVVDLSGGGDLLAYEFISGPGGTRDVLDPLVRPDQFAVIPGFSSAYAPYDSHEYQGSTLQPGQQVYLSGGGGLAAGYYTLLPARYALLPDAYLVRGVSGYQDLPSGTALPGFNGATIVSGRNAFSGAGIMDSRSSGFEVRPGSAARRDANYQLSTANAFFPQRATASDTPLASALPRDAGGLDLSARSRLTLDATLRSTVGSGGRGASLNLSSAQLRITDGAPSDNDGFVEIGADRINAFGAQTTVIGGRLVESGPASARLDVAADVVEVVAGAELNGPEIILVARDDLAIGAGASITATGEEAAGHDEITTDANSSLLRVSTGDQVDIVRNVQAGTGAGGLTIATGAAIGGRSATIDAGGIAQTEGRFVVDGSLSLAARRIGLGDAPADYAGLVVDPEAMAGSNLAELRLTGRNAIDLFAGTSLQASDLRLTAPLIAAAAAGLDVSISANTLRLAGAAQAGAATAGDSTLSLSAAKLELGGNLAFSGFDNLQLAASGDVHVVDSGALRTTGDLQVQSSRMLAGQGDDYRIDTAGPLLLTAAAGQAGGAYGELGGLLWLNAASITGTANILAPSGRIELNATGGDIRLDGNSRLDVSGRDVTFDGEVFGSRGGSISLTASQGSIAAATGTSMDVSGATAAQAGVLQASAEHGTLQLSGQLQGSSTVAGGAGSASYTAGNLNLPDLLPALAAGGFSGALAFHSTRAGDLLLAAGSTLRASRVDMTADAGRIDIAGNILADSATGGAVTLSASGPVAVAGSVSARATGDGEEGGRVEIASGAGLVLASGSTIDVSGAHDAANGGEVHLRVQREALETLLDGNAGNDTVRLAGNLVGADSIALEGHAVYDVAGGVIADEQVAADAANPWFADAAGFQSNATAITAALGRSADPAFQVTPGIELRSDGDLVLASDWNLADWRFGGAPGVLTLRAAGDLVFERSLSDGFSSATDFRLPQLAADSWSYRLVAGADLGSAALLGTVSAEGIAGGDLRLAAGVPHDGFSVAVPVMVRTGTGRIDIAAARDVALGNQASVIYTAGTAGAGIRLDNDRGVGGLSGLAYPDDGGEIAISVGRDFVGAQSSQLFTEWQWRAGSNSDLFPSATAWVPAFEAFEQGVATLGGGNLRVVAGRDIVDGGFNTPSIGRQVGGQDPASSVVEIVGGGHLDVAAGRDILGGTYYSDLGHSRIVAGNSIGTSPGQNGAGALAPVLALGGGSIEVSAVRDARIAAIVNPTLLELSANTDRNAPSYFSTYQPDSAVSITSAAGSIGVMSDLFAVTRRFTSYPRTTGADVPLRILPPSLKTVALSDSIRVGSSMSLWPAPRGGLQLYAAEDIGLESLSASGGGSLDILISDASIDNLPVPDRPVEMLESTQQILGSATPTDLRFNASVPVHAGTGDLPRDTTPVTLVAARGDVTMQTLSTNSVGALYSAKPIKVVAGRDIVNMAALVQNLDASDVTTFRAGRDITYLSSRDPGGSLLPNTSGVVVDGPGYLDVVAGRSVDLQASAGFVTQGNLRNAALPDGGADINVLAGIAGQSPAYQPFTRRYLVDGTLYDQELFAYAAQAGVEASDKTAALAWFQALDETRQRQLLQQVLMSELRAGGRIAAAPGDTNGDYSRAFTALTTLFPGSNPATEKDEVNPWSGDIRLYFSRMYTLDGGDISLLAPGGEINVGLAAPPKDFGIDKRPSELGLVVQSTGSLSAASFRDFQVNESRAFAADGGNILVWSTSSDIDAGRGAKTAISAPRPVVTVDAQGRTTVTFPAALSGSGIQTLATSEGRKPGDVDLFAPQGVVNAGDAGIVAGNLTIGATAVLGANNITVSGSSVGVPVDTGGLGVSLSDAAGASAAANAAGQQVVETSEEDRESAPLAQVSIAWLEVFVEGFGTEACKPEDEECLKRNRSAQP